MKSSVRLTAIERKRVFLQCKSGILGKMAKEIERKFLVRDVEAALREATGSVELEQGYLSSSPRCTVRVRLNSAGGAFITIKGLTMGASRSEWEYPVPPEDARAMLEECGSGVLVKTRHFVPARGGVEGLCWEIDCFHGALEGLVLAEIELPEENTGFLRPEWLGEEVTGDVRYYNSMLAAQGRP